MKYLLLYSFSVLVTSCVYDNKPTSLSPIQVSRPLLVGSWKMETNRGINVSFDILEYNGKSWTRNVILSYNGVTTVPGEGSYPIYAPISDNAVSLQMWTSRSVNIDAENMILYSALQPNTTCTQLVGSLGYANIFGIGNLFPSSFPVLDTINFKPPIVINKIK